MVIEIRSVVISGREVGMCMEIGWKGAQGNFGESGNGLS